ncbi:hypothetical protein FB565_005453 [Actinoplanes lutulentus]|uniref:Uncharacterized protein n=1 Tax=Actinoplanes lutulentus TaxID=1287878 RepID=A0A327ZDJ0_9ACTN|nr:hypothetical protein [Actinoplanes lutulentus]MBB2945695.1 hypothetical protein [Actinoplanes lutulentus]RAK37744.1 hypothetical protein B0I29_10610 [Actinoplanes lutulentus]
MTEQAEQAEQRGLVPAQAAPPQDDPWADYLAAARDLDAVRRAASSMAGEHAETVTAARQELSSVRARLSPQRARLTRDFGVPDLDLTPQPEDQAVAMAKVAGGPAAVLAALREARVTADAADHAFIGPAPTGPHRPYGRNLLVYGPFAAVVLLVQVILFLLVGSPPDYALWCALSMPLLAFGLGWATIGFVYEDEGVKVDRTPVLGVIVCLVPVLLTCAGQGLQALFN